MADNTLTLKFDEISAMALVEKVGKEIVLPIVNEAGKSAYAIAVAHGYKGTESEWLESIRGVQGPQGLPGPQGEPGPIGKPGPQGEPGSATNAAQLLKSKNIYLENTKVDTILTKLIEKLSESGYIAEGSFRLLEYTQPRKGQDYIDLTGEPHFKVAVNGGEKREFESDNMRVAIEPFGPKNIELKYYDLNDNEQTTLIIRGANATADQTETADNGVIYNKFGNDLEIDVSNYNGTSVFNFAPSAWIVSNNALITIKTNKKAVLLLNDASINNNQSEPIIDQYSKISVTEPTLVIFKGINSDVHMLLGFDNADGTHTYAFNRGRDLYIVWDSNQNKYVGSATETL